MTGSFALLLWAWIETARNMGRLRLWSPFLLYFLIQAGAVLLLTRFHEPILAPVLVPVVRAIAGEPALHYPLFYLALPSVFSRLSLGLDLIFGAWLIGAAFLYFRQADRPTERVGGSLATATRAWPRLILLRLPVILLLYGSIYLLPQLVFGRPEEVGGNTVRLIRYGSFLVGVILEALFLYAPIVLLVERRGILAALGRSLRIFGRLPGITLAVVLVPNLVQLPISFVLRHAETIVRRLSPEMVAWALVLAAGAYLVATFFIVGAGARLYRVETEGFEG
ncbi:MAG: hypothetical protein GF346_04775 [Candidatus Eisenbacteria bacterium]|nr:hypothetical protein [Candidatus Latescibacterota bacterium]MBD3301740.1 hypothetical protein [Candidatus Eisenbacteria bacterium]